MMGRAHALLYFSASLVPRVTMFLLLLVLTRLLPVDDYGLFTLVVTTGEILDAAASNWIRIFILRSEGTRPASEWRLGRALVLTAGSCAVSLLAAAGLSLIQPNLPVQFAIAVLLYVLAFATLRLGLTLLQTQQQHVTYAAIEIARGLLTVIGAASAVVFVGHGFFEASLGASLMVLGLAVVACGLAMRRLPRPALPPVGYRAALMFGIPLVAVAVATQVAGLIDRYILNHALGPASVGLYAAAYALARQPVDLFSGSLNPYLFPMLVRSYSAGGPRAAGYIQAGSLIALSVLCAAVAVGICLLAEPFVELVLPEPYRVVAARVMPWIALATLLSALKNFCFDNVFHISGKNWRQFATIAPAAVLSAVLGVLLIPEGGPVAAAIIAAGAAALMLVGSLYLSCRILPFSVPPGAVAGFGVSLALASGAAYAVKLMLGAQPPLVILIGATLAFVVVYAAALTMSGFSLLRFLDRPWEVWQGRPGRRETATPAPP